MRLVRLKTPWRMWSKGHVFIAMPPNQARTMVARGVAEWAGPDPAIKAAEQARVARELSPILSRGKLKLKGLS